MKLKNSCRLGFLAACLIPSSTFAVSNDEYNTVVDVSFTWTQERQNNYGGANQVLANMNASLGITNVAHDNSNTGMFFNYIINTGLVNYNANGGDLSSIADLRGNRVPSTFSDRGLAGADVMGLNCNMAAAGLAYVGDPRQYAVKFLTGPASAHELGHTFGCGHGGVGASYSSGVGETPYAGGWATNNGGTRRGTIMTGAQILWYSTPEKTFNGETTGIPNVKDSTRRIRETRRESSRISKLKPEGGRAGGWWRIVNRYSNQNAGMKQYNSNNGTALALRADNGNYSQWRFENAGIGGGWLNGVNRATGKAIDKGSNPGSGNIVKQWTLFNNSNQQFKLDHDDSGLVRLRFANGNTSLANRNRQTFEGNKIGDLSYGGESHIQWYLVRQN